MRQGMPGSFGMRDGKVVPVTPEEQKAIEKQNKRFVKVSLLYWLCAFVALILLFVVAVLQAPAEPTGTSPDDYMGMMLGLIGWIGVSGIGYSILYWFMVRRNMPKATPDAKDNKKEPWE